MITAIALTGLILLVVIIRMLATIVQIDAPDIGAYFSRLSGALADLFAVLFRAILWIILIGYSGIFIYTIFNH